MARARKGSSKKGTVKVNFKDVESKTRVNKEGDYPLKCIEAISGKSGAGNEQIEFTFEVSDGEFEGAKAWFYCPLQENSLWKLHGLLTAMGVDVPEEEMDIDLSELVDCEVVGVFTPDTYNGKRQFKMTDFCSMDDYEGGDKKSKKKGKKDEDDEEDEKKSKKSKAGKGKSKKDEPETPDYDDLDEDELRELYLERELGSKKEAKKLDEDELKEALEEADEAAAKSSKGKGKKSKSDDDDEEDDDKSSKGKKGKDKKKSKAKKYDKSDVEDMDEDELQELLEEAGLEDEVDLDDYKKLPKKVAAVIEALDDADMLEDDD